MFTTAHYFDVCCQLLAPMDCRTVVLQQPPICAAVLFCFDLSQGDTTTAAFVLKCERVSLSLLQVTIRPSNR